MGCEQHNHLDYSIIEPNLKNNPINNEFISQTESVTWDVNRDNVSMDLVQWDLVLLRSEQCLKVSGPDYSGERTQR